MLRWVSNINHVIINSYTMLFTKNYKALGQLNCHISHIEYHMWKIIWHHQENIITYNILCHIIYVSSGIMYRIFESVIWVFIKRKKTFIKNVWRLIMNFVIKAFVNVWYQHINPIITQLVLIPISYFRTSIVLFFKISLLLIHSVNVSKWIRDNI